MPATVPSTKAFQSLGGSFTGLAIIDDPHGAVIMRDAVALSEILELRQDVGEVRPQFKDLGKGYGVPHSSGAMGIIYNSQTGQGSAQGLEGLRGGK